MSRTPPVRSSAISRKPWGQNPTQSSQRKVYTLLYSFYPLARHCLSMSSTQDVQVEALLNIRFIVKGSRPCRFEVNIAEVFTANKKRGEPGNGTACGQLSHPHSELVDPLWLNTTCRHFCVGELWYIFFSSLTRLRREPSVSIRKKYPLEPRVVGPLREKKHGVFYLDGFRVWWIQISITPAGRTAIPQHISVFFFCDETECAKNQSDYRVLLLLLQ